MGASQPCNAAIAYYTQEEVENMEVNFPFAPVLQSIHSTEETSFETFTPHYFHIAFPKPPPKNCIAIFLIDP